LGLEPVEHEVAMKGNQLEAAVKRVGNAETGEKDRRARLGDDGVVETQRGIAVAVAAKKRCKRHGSVDTSIGGHRRVFRSGAAVDTVPRGSAICDPKMGAGALIFNRSRGAPAPPAAAPESVSS